MPDATGFSILPETLEESCSIVSTPTEGAKSDPSISLLQPAAMLEAYLALALLPLRVGKGRPSLEGKRREY